MPIRRLISRCPIGGRPIPKCIAVTTRARGSGACAKQGAYAGGVGGENRLGGRVLVGVRDVVHRDAGDGHGQIRGVRWTAWAFFFRCVV